MLWAFYEIWHKNGTKDLVNKKLTTIEWGWHVSLSINAPLGHS